MKKISLLIVLMVGLLFVSGCGNSKEEYNGKVFSFSYSYISEDEGSCDYNIVYNGSTLNYTAFGKSGNNTYIMKEIDKSYIDELTKFVKDNKIEDWNGFNKSKDDEKRNGFSLEIGYSDGKNIIAAGNNEFPDDYEKVHKNIIEFLNKLK